MTPTDLLRVLSMSRASKTANISSRKKDNLEQLEFSHFILYVHVTLITHHSWHSEELDIG
jgi:hypothetical protein